MAEEQHWEYGTVNISGYGSGGWLIDTPTGGLALVVQASQRIEIGQFLEKVATPGGWELTGVVPGQEQSLLVFKRPQKG